MSSDSNKREFTRVPSRLEVDLKAEDGTEITSYLENLSLRGVFLPTEHKVQEGTACRVVMHLGGRDRGLALEAGGVVARNTDEGVAVRFKEIAYEAFEHLRNLVLFNARDPEVVEDELASRLGIDPGE